MAKAWCQEYHITSFIETSARTSQNVTAAFISAVQQWQNQERYAERMNLNDTIDLTKSVQLNRREKNSCCGNTNPLPNRQEVLQ